MNPASAMGMFLRTWRAEWARMSRAQLANAVSALCKKRKRVTPFIVQEWEDGQPPKTTAELDGLCQVMARNGLIQPETEDFRRLVFTACADRQYPELFAGEELVHRAEIADVAHAFYDPRREPNRYGAVHLVPLLKELEDVVYRGSSPPRVRRAQEEALCVLLTVSAGWHNSCLRHALAVSSFDAVSEAIERFFGPGANLGGLPAITSLTMRVSALSSRGILACSRLAGSPEWNLEPTLRPNMERLWLAILDVADEAQARGDAAAADRAFLSGTDPLWLGRGLYERHRERFAELLVTGGAHLGDPGAVNLTVHRVLVHEGRFGEAERHVGGFEVWRDGDPTGRCRWHNAMGETAFLQGNWETALGEFQAGLDTARADRNAWFERVFRQRAEACERAERAEPKRSISVPRRAGRRKGQGPS